MHRRTGLFRETRGNDGEMTVNESATTDRYVSFCGIECDIQAQRLINKLRQHLLRIEPSHPWRRYFEQKFEQQAKMNHDDLFYVGSQLNNLYTFFEEQGDDEAAALLWKLEMECC